MVAVRTIDSITVNRVFDRFGRLLQYPDAQLPADVREARTLIRSVTSAADGELAAFEAFVNEHDLDGWRQTYTDAFDLDPLFKIYIGYHLFGETYKRSRFLVTLNAHYAEHGYDCAPELPDHLAVVLRFLPHCDHEAFLEGLIDEGIVPSVKNMLGKSSTTGCHEGASAPTTGPQSLQDAIRSAQSAFYQPDEIRASWHPEAFGQGIVTKGLQDARPIDPFPNGDESDHISCGPCPPAGGAMTADLGMQLKGVPEHEKERDMRKEEVRRGEEERQSHPYAHVLRALEQVVDAIGILRVLSNEKG